MKIRKSILIVDDDTFFLNALSDVLKDAGFRVLTALSWVDVAQIIRLNVPDLILLDYIIPSLDGSKICNILKKNRKTKNVPILLYSGIRPEELKQRAVEVGAEGVLEKSQNFEQIVLAIQQFLQTLES